MKIYIVQGGSGEYDDYSSWLVMAYFSRIKAEEHAANAQQRAKELNARYGIYNIPKMANEFDPDMRDDSHIHYDIQELEVGDELIQNQGT
jgi:hypothetical protein